MPTAEKTAAIEQLQETIKGAAAIFLADFTGLNVEKMTSLRRKCRENGVYVEVVKNTLAIRATRALELGELEPHFRGPTLLAVSREDATSPARVLVDFRKEHEKPELKLGFVEGRILSAKEVEALANLPTRDQLIAQVMQLALAPVQNLAMVLQGITTKLVRTVDAVREGMEKGTIAAAVPAEKTGGEAVSEKKAEPEAAASTSEPEDASAAAEAAEPEPGG
jgi:large subunit ribosomal protein L10